MTAEKDVQVARKKTFFFSWGVPLVRVMCYPFYNVILCYGVMVLVRDMSPLRRSHGVKNNVMRPEGPPTRCRNWRIFFNIFVWLVSAWEHLRFNGSPDGALSLQPPRAESLAPHNVGAGSPYFPNAMWTRVVCSVMWQNSHHLPHYLQYKILRVYK